MEKDTIGMEGRIKDSRRRYERSQNKMKCFDVVRDRMKVSESISQRNKIEGQRDRTVVHGEETYIF